MRELERGEPLAAAAWAQIAGDYVFRNHPGRFYSPALESLLAEVGRRLQPQIEPGPAPESSKDVKRVLHVLTEAYATGGHTRLARRWMERDASRRHTVVLTSQGPPPPENLGQAAEASGGRLYQFARSDGLFPRAVALRELAADADMVVLHDHMHDVIPALAFAVREARPAVLGEDHADHMFWLGTEAVDGLAELRAPAAELAVRRRGFDPEDIALVPIPLELPAQSFDRLRARERLKIPRNAQVLLTVAASFKFSPVLDTTYHALIGQVLKGRPRTLLLAAGPGADEPGWRGLVRRFPGQVRALGPVHGLEPYYAAADIYVDSYPAGSATSALEAALHGLPVVSFGPDVAGYASMLEHGPGLERGIVRESTPESWRKTVIRLLGSEPLRRELGERARLGVEAVHVGEAWNAAVEHAYETALSAHRHPRRRHPVTDPELPEGLGGRGVHAVSGDQRPHHAGVEHPDAQRPAPARSAPGDRGAGGGVRALDRRRARRARRGRGRARRAAGVRRGRAARAADRAHRRAGVARRRDGVDRARPGRARRPGHHASAVRGHDRGAAGRRPGARGQLNVARAASTWSTSAPLSYRVRDARSPQEAMT